LYKLAAKQGYAPSQYNLALLYRNGEGVAQDYKEAVRLYKLAAKQGNADAQYNLALGYAHGNGVIQDMVLAHMWFNIAASNGHENANTNRNVAESLMTSEQIAKAKELARECIKKNYKDCG